MLRIVLISVNGSLVQLPVLAEFGEAGGGIGRDESNALVLPDPERRLSRVQAIVRFEHGTYRLIDQGASPTVLNGVPLRKGNSRILREGDIIEAAGFMLKVFLFRDRDAQPAPQEPELPRPAFVQNEAPKKTVDPFDDLLLDAQAGNPRAASNSSVVNG